MKALILAAGEGRRLRPLTHAIPKPLLPVANQPLIFYAMDQLEQAGIQEVGIVVSPQNHGLIGSAIQERNWNCEITFIIQETPLGSAHAVKQAYDFLREQPFVLYYGDNFIGEGIQRGIQEFLASGADIVLMLKDVDDARSFGVAEIDRNNYIVRIEEKPEKPRSNKAITGSYIFSPSIFAALNHIRPSPRGELEITDAIEKLLATGSKIKGCLLNGCWYDTGTWDNYLEVNKEVLNTSAKRDVQGSVDAASKVIGKVRVAKGARIECSEVEGPAIIGERSFIHRARIGPFTVVGHGCIIEDVEIEHSIILDEVEILHAGCLAHSILGESSRIARDGRDGSVKRLFSAMIHKSTAKQSSSGVCCFPLFGGNFDGNTFRRSKLAV